jgi:hypothetical protein
MNANHTLSQPHTIRVTGIVRGARATVLRAQLLTEAQRGGHLRVELRQVALDPMVDRILDDVRRLLELRGGRLETVVCGGVSVSKARLVTLPAEPDGDWHDLTYAEQRVPRFVGEGLTNNAVAAALVVARTRFRHISATSSRSWASTLA